MTVDTDPYVAIIDELATRTRGCSPAQAWLQTGLGPETFSSRSPRLRRTRSWLPDRPRNG